MAILHGELDETIPWREVAEFSGWYQAHLMLLKDGNHNFRSEPQQKVLSSWLDEYMSPIHVEPWLERLVTNTDGGYALKILLQESKYSNSCGSYLPQFAALLEHKNSRIRSRALVLFAENAKWDSQQQRPHSR